jgi:hypothetical protein
MNWFVKYILFGWLWGNDDDDAGKVEIGAHVFMPLFVRVTSGLIATWEYMARPDSERKQIRDYIKANAAPGETPAITFCLTPWNVNGHTIPDNMSDVNGFALGVIRAMCKELVQDGIAVFLTLYVDDAAPRWMNIKDHRAVWKKVHKEVKDLVSGAILSIESNEHAIFKADIEKCIAVMQEIMPGFDYYGTHLQWGASGRYRWTGGSSTPSNANIILAENTWDPQRGDAAGVSKIRSEWQSIRASEQRVKLVAHEYNLNAGGTTEKAQRAELRAQGIWGIG